jgi:anti-sigma factor RsiW
MSCEQVVDRLDAYVDGDLAEAEFQDVELHLLSCAACRAEEQALRSLLAQAAALPRELAPSRDLWEGIEARLGSRRAAPPWVRSFLLSPVTLAAASIVLAVLAARLPTPPSLTPGSGEAAPVALDPSIAQAEAQYTRAAAGLKTALDGKRESLSPETVKAVEKDLQVIDQALGSLRLALQKEPGNTELAQLLMATHKRKLDILQKVARLSDAS